MRPTSLEDVAKRTSDVESFDLVLRNFLDGFYADPSPAALAAEPRLFGESYPSGLVMDAFLGAAAEMLATRFGFDTPVWAFAENRKLKHPWFALEYASMRAVLLWESPAAFRSRNLFVSENALSRA